MSSPDREWRCAVRAAPGSREVKVSTDFVARNGKSKMAEMQLKRPDLAVKSLMCEQSRSGVTVRSAHRAGQSRII